MLDEPLAALDRALRVDLQEELRERIHGAGIPAIYVTHDQEEALIVSDYLALLHDGQIVQSGLTADVFKYPCNRWVASFLGMTNFIEGEVISTVPLTVKTSLGIFKPDPSHLAGNIKTGTRITLLLKPSGLSIVDQEDENNVTGLVKQCDFRGDHYRLLLETQSGKVLEFNVDQFTRIGEKTTIQLPREAVIPMAS